jgi:hypothetical protein
MISLAQLVCFYYVLTTFTTVGYGPKPRMNCVVSKWRFLSVFIFARPYEIAFVFFNTGDISASTDGERVWAPDAMILYHTTKRFDVIITGRCFVSSSFSVLRLSLEP